MAHKYNWRVMIQGQFMMTNDKIFQYRFLIKQKPVSVEIFGGHLWRFLGQFWKSLKVYFHRHCLHCPYINCLHILRRPGSSTTMSQGVQRLWVLTGA